MSTTSVTQSTKPMETTQPTQALATRSANAGVITAPDQFTRKVAEWQGQGLHVLAPMANFSALPASYGIVPALVKIDPNPEAGDVYRNPAYMRSENQVAIAKLGLAKIAQAAGMTIKTERTDNRLIPNLWEVRATVRFIGLDGTPQELDATEEVDLRDGSPRLKGFQPNQVLAFRAKGLRHCEARAITAAIRQFGIKQVYTKEELARPFVTLRMVFTPDMSDAAVRQQVTDRALAGSTSLYPSLVAAAARPAPEPLDVIGEGGRSPEEIDQRPAKPQGRVVEEARFDMDAGLFEVRLDGGELAYTANQDLGKQLNDARKSGRRVLLTTDDDSRIKTCEFVAEERKL